MSALLATQPNAGPPVNALTNRNRQPSHPAEAAGTNSLTASDIAERFDQLQQSMGQLLENVGAINANIALITTNTNQNTLAIAQNTLAIAQNTQNIAQNTNDISHIRSTTVQILKLLSQQTEKINCMYVYFSLFEKIFLLVFSTNFKFEP